MRNRLEEDLLLGNAQGNVELESLRPPVDQRSSVET